MDRFYINFCEQAIRCMFVCGFVPWRLRRLSTGDPVPEVLPLGMFTWSVETLAEREMSSSAGGARGDRGYSTNSYRSAGHNNNNNGQRQTVAVGAGQHRPTQQQQKKKQGDGGEEDEKSGAKKRSRDEEEKEKDPPAIHLRQKRALQRQRAPVDDEYTKILRYRIHFTQNCGIEEADVEIFEYIQPNKDVTLNSPLYSTVSSPLAHIIHDYRAMRRAMIQREYADTWNTQAKMVCSYTSDKNQWNISEGNPITGDSWTMPQNRLGLTTDTNLPIEIEQNAYARDAVMETITSSKHERHKPVVYTLPKNSKLEDVSSLTMIQDTKEMQVKLAKDITSIMGIPYELVGGGYSDKEGKKKSMENTRIFTTNMMNICKHLESLLADVYVATYGDDRSGVKFILRPTPRIEIGSVEEIVMLLEAGVVSADNAVQLSNMLLGVDLRHFAGSKANAGPFAKTFMTPGNKKDLIVAQSAAQKAAAAGGKK